MKKSKFYIFIFSILFISSCNNDDDNQVISCDDTVIISLDLYNEAPAEQVDINNVEIIGNCFMVNFSASGCDGSNWEIQLIDANQIKQSGIPQRNIRLSFKSNEVCEAYITKEVSFDIQQLQLIGSESILFNLLNNDSQILYEY